MSIINITYANIWGHSDHFRFSMKTDFYSTVFSCVTNQCCPLKITTIPSHPNYRTLERRSGDVSNRCDKSPSETREEIITCV